MSSWSTSFHSERSVNIYCTELEPLFLLSLINTVRLDAHNTSTDRTLPLPLKSPGWLPAARSTTRNPDNHILHWQHSLRRSHIWICGGHDLRSFISASPFPSHRTAATYEQKLLQTPPIQGTAFARGVRSGLHVAFKRVWYPVCATDTSTRSRLCEADRRFCIF